MNFNVSFGWLLICSCLYCFISVLPGVISTVCSDAANDKNIKNVISMCESGNAVANKIVVDTYDSALYGEGSCRCDITFIVTDVAQLTYNRVDQLHPNVVNCGSEITFNIDGISSIFHCTLFKSSKQAVSQNTPSYLTWESKRQNSRSGYCVLFELTPDAAKLNITCIATTRSLTTKAPSTTPKPTTLMSTTTSAKTTSPTAVTSSSPESTTTQPTTTTTSPATSTTPPETTTSPSSQSANTGNTNTGVEINITKGIVTSTAMSGSTDKQTITTGGLKNSNNGQEKDFLMTVILPAAGAGGGLVLIITVVALIVICRRKQNPKENNNKEEEEDGGMQANVLYISADEVVDIKLKIAESNYDYATDTEDKNDASQNKEYNNEGEVSSPEEPQGAVYAVVNKQKTAGNVENTKLRSSSKNEEGLNYTEVEFTGDIDRPPSIPPPLISVTDDEDKRVTYSEVRTNQND